MIDTHAHVNFNAFKDDFDDVIKRGLAQNTQIINVGSQLSTSKRAIDFAKQYANCFASIGLHPIHLQDMLVEEEGEKFTTRKEDFSYEAYKELAKQPKVIAIGETGLDYWHLNNNEPAAVAIARQKQVFAEHIKLANELNLPVIVHCRGLPTHGFGKASAYDEILEELTKQPPENGGIMHCFGGLIDLVEKFVDLGLYISFNGILTFDKTGHIADILRATPDDKILTETDCPYLTPEPHRGKRNEPAFVEFVIKKIAEIKGMTFDKVDELTTNNAKRLFAI
ncbi:TatD family hydrolase [Candidatus Falkowbacteria bacterium]|nr:TatD family hydrolase [Candidatus Falkowbacteria bacterium]